MMAAIKSIRFSSNIFMWSMEVLLTTGIITFIVCSLNLQSISDKYFIIMIPSILLIILSAILLYISTYSRKKYTSLEKEILYDLNNGILEYILNGASSIKNVDDVLFDIVKSHNSAIVKNSF